MPITMHPEDANIYRIEIRGTLRKADLDATQHALVAEMKRVGPVRVLFVLEGFDGWSREDNWSDMSFYVKHGSTIERIAIVGPERWRTETMMFAAADLRKAPVEFFPDQSLAEARTWLTA